MTITLERVGRFIFVLGVLRPRLGKLYYPRGDDLQNKPFCSFDFRQLPKVGQLYQVYELNCRFITRGGAR